MFFLHGIADARLITTKKEGQTDHSDTNHQFCQWRDFLEVLPKVRCKENWITENGKRDQYCSLSAEWRKKLIQGEKTSFT